jgi:hypothetical protein
LAAAHSIVKWLASRGASSAHVTVTGRSGRRMVEASGAVTSSDWPGGSKAMAKRPVLVFRARGST